ncbi:glycosyltransferase family 2 protein [Alphaproteobacteria bacterium]|nr:glycosyltransferase family 2 protein [Alphaproteobacteria bacterium]
MKKLVIQIPCFNEEETLPFVINDLKMMIESTDCEVCKNADIQIIDDGSSDNTSNTAKSLGIKRIYRKDINIGLARSFRRGAEMAVQDGYDILVNLDGDNQYNAFDVPLLVKNHLENGSNIVVGCRPILSHTEFSLLKKILQIIGSAALRFISNTKVRDAASGFRLYDYNYLTKMRIHTTFSYCIETLIDAGSKGFKISSVNISVNKATRESRLFKTKTEYIKKQLYTMILVFSMHQPLKFYSMVASPFIIISLTLMLRFILKVYFLTDDQSRTHLPSLIIGSLSFTTGLLIILIGVLAEVLKLTRESGYKNW